ncbi:hypothetical protein PT974_05953 [Cladobotryum mycophilum]|uniref:PhoD-like phosphatase domain-containing protein n=1 Tax=Cladobotryum mycophilum TaxID=491253 RepID=A0ABR0SLG5_9HYPO
MSAPYWGELPQPKKIHDGRLSEDYSYEYSNPDQRQSLDIQPPRKANRNSIQTTYTEAPTETTFSPHSPTSSTIAPHGLAPRPPSYQQGQSLDMSFEPYDKTSRRSNRMPDERDEPSSPSMPAAPEAPRGPPVSYRQPNGPYPYAYPSPGSSRPPRQPFPGEAMGTEEYFPPERFDGQPGPSQRPIEDVVARRDSKSSAQPVTGQSRRASASGTSDRRKKFADDRSPLQRLELTLDSMTKEEKRARVEAAEQRAKARAAKKAALQASGGQVPQQQELPPLVVQDRRPAASLEQASPIVSNVPFPREAAAPREAPASQIRPPQTLQEDNRAYVQGPIQQTTRTAADPQSLPTEADFGIPKRNMSFRERAVRDDPQFSNVETHSPPDEPLIPPSSGFSLARSGSNKLKKEPPADSWHRIRMEAERRLPPQSKPASSNDAGRAPQELAQQSTHSSPRYSGDKELPPLPLNPTDQLPPPQLEETRLQESTSGPDKPGIRRRTTEPPAVYVPELGHNHTHHHHHNRKRKRSCNSDLYHSPNHAHNRSHGRYRNRKLKPKLNRDLKLNLSHNYSNRNHKNDEDSPSRKRCSQSHKNDDDSLSRNHYNQNRKNDDDDNPCRKRCNQNHKNDDDSLSHFRCNHNRSRSRKNDNDNYKLKYSHKYFRKYTRKHILKFNHSHNHTHGSNHGSNRSYNHSWNHDQSYDQSYDQNHGQNHGQSHGQSQDRSQGWSHDWNNNHNHNHNNSNSNSNSNNHRNHSRILVRISGMVFKRREDLRPGEGLYQPPQWLDEWKKGTVGTLSGTLLDLSPDQMGPNDKNTTWWDQGGNRRNQSVASRPRKAEAFEGEYDDSAATRFKPPLYLKCGPLLRYCGIRRERVPARPRNNNVMLEREIWRGTIMIVTSDADSSYEIAPTLRLFLQDVELLPPPPQHVNGELSPEYVDPIAGHPKLGRRGETLYVRPVDHLEEAKDLSRDETDEGLFEKTKSPPDELLPNGLTDYPGSFASRRRRVDVDGEKMLKYKDVRGFRLHAEQGCTFWRFNIEVELREKQQRIAYRINRGPAMAFWVPASGEAMNIMFYSCNGFSLKAKPDELSGPDPMWRDVLNSHQTQPFHVMVGGGDQIYNDCVADECELFDEWLDINNPIHKHSAAFTNEMQSEIEKFYLERYCMWFSQGLFGLANSQIPMVNMYDDHDVFDGYGSYPHHDMNSPVFSGLGAVAFKYYMLFQHQSIVTETENTEPSWILGEKPGPYIKEHSRSLYMSMGGKVALLAVDGRTERTERTVIDEKTWEKMMNRLYAEVRRGQVEHLLVLLGVPIAYPRLVWLENILTSKPVKALGRAGLLGKHLNNIDGGVEVLDDLNDHWTAKNHKHERTIVIEDLQDLAIDKSLRITVLSGDVHLAAIGQFYSNPKLGLAKHKDPRYMPNIISSAIVNMPPPDLLADVLNKRNKVHHFDKQTDESMIPIFRHGVDGKSRNNKNLLPHRNWCSIRLWQPGNTPPPSPPVSDDESPAPQSGGGGLFRRLSKGKSSSKNFDMSRESVRGPRPPVSSGIGGLFRSLSRSRSKKQQGPPPTRTMSLGRGEAQQRGGDMPQYGRPASQSQNDHSIIQGQWGAEDMDYGYVDPRGPGQPGPSGLRGGAATFDEFSEGDESFFTAQPPRRAQTMGNQPMAAGNELEDAPVRPFHRTPTGLSTKQMRQAEKLQVDLEGGLDISLNVEVNPRDPTGITVPYRILVPKLFYDYSPEEDDIPVAGPSGIRRFLSLGKKPQRPQEEEPAPEDEEEQYESENEANYETH